MSKYSTSVMPCSAGVLGECPGLNLTPFGNYHQRLTWDPPSTLNITEVEPDISSYIVCSNITNECSTINVTEAGEDSSDLRQYTFPNLRAYVNFTVTAVNIVDDGGSTSIVYEPCEHQELLPGKYEFPILVCYLVSHGIFTNSLVFRRSTAPLFD